MFKWIIILLFLMAILLMLPAWSSATNYFVGDSTGGASFLCSNGGIALGYEYIRGKYPLPGTDSVTIDSVWYRGRNGANGNDSIWIGVRVANGSGAPGTASLICQAKDTVSDNTCGTRRTMLISGGPKLKGGDSVSFGLGLPSTNGSSFHINASSTTSVFGCYSSTSAPSSSTGLPGNFVCNNSYAAVGPFEIGIWCHGTAGGGGPTTVSSLGHGPGTPAIGHSPSGVTQGHRP